MSEPQYRYPHPLRPDEPIVFVQWHIASQPDDDGGLMSPLAPEWWDGVSREERESGLETLRGRVAEQAAEQLGRPISLGEISYTVHRRDAGPVRPDEEPTP